MFLSVEQTVSQTLPASVVDSADEITVTHLPNRKLYETVPAVKKLLETNSEAKIVPHIAARNLYSDRELIECCQTFKDLGISTVLLIGGSVQQGRYYQSVYEICRTLSDFGLNKLCAVYPQQETVEQVKRKKYSNFASGITQFCLNPKLLNLFHTNTRIGVPSMCAAGSLLKYMKRCGVINSAKTAAGNISGVRYFGTQGFDTVRFVKQINNSSFHVYNFGKIENTVRNLRELS